MSEDAREAGSGGFGTLLRRHRLEAGLSQQALAERAKMSTNGIGALERGDRRTPQRETLSLLLSALTLTPAQRDALEVAACRPAVQRADAVSSGANAWPEISFSHLPVALTSFVGREREVAEIETLARAHRLVSLTGSGGIGKTRAALEVGYALGPTSSDGVWLVELAPLGDPALVAVAIAAALDAQELPNQRLRETLVSFFKRKTLVLILDNCEHVIDEVAGIVDEVLRACQGVRILATSREPLRVAGERTYRMPGLATPADNGVRALRAVDVLPFGAVELFVERARAADHRFELTDDNASTVAEICRRLDGIPLAIELGAARVPILPIGALAAKLDRRFRILTGGERTALPRQQTMRATIDWSYDLLCEREQRLFERLSVFAGGCTLAVATAVCADEDDAEFDVLETLTSLVDKSLVVAEFESDVPRYGLLGSFRAYALERLGARGEHEALVRKHALAYLALAEDIERTRDFQPDREWRRRALPELDNWRAALDAALTGGGDVVLGQRLVAALYPTWYSIARRLEGRRWAESALGLVDGGTPLDVVARLRFAEAMSASQLGNFELQVASGLESIALFRELGSEAGLARALSITAFGLATLRRPGEAQPLLLEALALTRRNGVPRAIVFVLRMMSHFAYSSRSDFGVARENLEEALSICKSFGAEILAAQVVAFDLAELELAAGNAELALHLMSGALPFFRANDAPNVSELLSNIASCLICLDRYDEAEKNALEAIALPNDSIPARAFSAFQRLAAVEALRPEFDARRRSGNAAFAAKLLGFVDARLRLAATPLEPSDERERVRAMTALRAFLDSDQLERLMAEGGAMSEERVRKLLPVDDTPTQI